MPLLRALALSISFLATPVFAFYQIELVARSGEFDSFGLSAPSIIHNSHPVIDDRGQVSFSYLGLDENDAQFYRRFWTLAPGGKGRDIYQAKSQNILSKADLNAKGELLFSEFNETQTQSILVYDPSSGQLTEALAPQNYPDTLGFTGLSFIGDDEFVWRGLNFSGERRLESSADVWKTLLKEGESKISYIFIPETQGQFMAAKVRLGEARQWGERRPDQILRWSLPLRTYEVVAEDRDSNPNSSFESFHNNLDLNSRGDVVFVASMADEKKGKAIVLKSKSKTYIVAREAESEISEIETFRPVLNDQKIVAFRAKDHKGKRCVFVWSPEQGLKKLVGESDIVPSDVQTARILDSDWGPGLAGSPWINNRNQLVFQAVLESKRGEKRLGGAVYRVDLEL